MRVWRKRIRVAPASRGHRVTRPTRVEPNVLEFTFEDEHGKTLMTMVQLGFASVERRDEHERGLRNAFARLQRIVRR